MLRILEEDTQLVANATRTTYEQLYYAQAPLALTANFLCKKAVAEGLVPKLKQLDHLIWEKIYNATSVSFR